MWKSWNELVLVFVIIRNHPAIAFFLLAFLLGSLPLCLVYVDVLPVAYSQLGALSASTAAVILCALSGGRKSVAELLGRGLIWKLGVKWWIAAFLYLLPVAVATLFIGSLLSGSSPDWSSFTPLYQVLPSMFVLIILAGLGEEFGWRGYLLPRLQVQHNALVSSLIVGVLHSLWHVPLFLVEGTVQHQWAGEIGLLPAFLGYAAFVIAWAIQLTWFFNNGRGSVLLVAVVHGSGNAWIGGYFDISGNAGIFGNNILTALMLLLSCALVVFARDHFTRAPGQYRYD